MSAIQTLPFALDESPADGTSNYESILGRTYINAEDSGLYRLVKWTGGDEVAGALAGRGISEAAITGQQHTPGVIGSTGTVENFVGIVHPSLTGPVLDNDYILVAVGGTAKVVDAGPAARGDLLGITAGPAGGVVAAGTSLICRTLAADGDGVHIDVEFTQEPKIQTAVA